MRISDQEQLTIRTYNSNAQQWAADHMTPGFWHDELIVFQEYLPTGRLLEIGSGGGRDARELIAAGYHFIGTDVSEGLIREARKNNPGVTFLHESVYDLDFPSHQFDGFWASAVLLHIPKAQLPRALAQIKRVVRPHGIGFISVKLGEGEVVEEQPGDDKRLFAYYQVDELRAVLELSDLNVLDMRTRKMSPKTTWITTWVEVGL